MKRFFAAGLVCAAFFLNFNLVQPVLLHTAYAQDQQEQKKYDLETLERMVAEGDAEGQYQLALKYNSGKGVEENLYKARDLLTQAADQGYAAAQHTLGVFYLVGMQQEDGKNIPQDIEKSLMWFRKAAEQDYTMALNSLAQFYLDGDNVPQDIQKGILLYARSAELGDAMAQFTLGMLNYTGASQNSIDGAQIIKKDRDKAIYWFSKGAEQGDKMSQSYLNEIKGISPPTVKLTESGDRKDFRILENMQKKYQAKSLNAHLVVIRAATADAEWKRSMRLTATFWNAL